MRQSSTLSMPVIDGNACCPLAVGVLGSPQESCSPRDGPSLSAGLKLSEAGLAARPRSYQGRCLSKWSASIHAYAWGLQRGLFTEPGSFLKPASCRAFTLPGADIAASSIRTPTCADLVRPLQVCRLVADRLSFKHRFRLSSACFCPGTLSQSATKRPTDGVHL